MNVIELTEGDNDDEKMFWMILGSEDYGKADYWKWRAVSEDAEPRVWRADASSNDVVRRFLMLNASFPNIGNL